MIMVGVFTAPFIVCYDLKCDVLFVDFQYDPIFGNAFWNSMQEPMAQYLLNMITSWAIVCDVWYLPPMKIQVFLVFPFLCYL